MPTRIPSQHGGVLAELRAPGSQALASLARVPEREIEKVYDKQGPPGVHRGPTQLPCLLDEARRPQTITGARRASPRTPPVPFRTAQ
jgi:hypothetical protein